jgi:hypothetical protein
MRRHTTHWTPDATLHAGSVADCADCAAPDLHREHGFDRVPHGPVREAC